MSNVEQISDKNSQDVLHSDYENEFLTIYINNQIFGLPVLLVQDVLQPQNVTRIPLAPPEIAGSLNLRGRIVTAVDVRTRLGITEQDSNKAETKSMSVVVEHEDELYSLIIDKVGDVLRLNKNTYESTPATLDPKWRDISAGIHQLENELLIILDIDKLINSLHP